MRTGLLGLAMCLVALGARATADEPKKDKESQVKEIDLKDLKVPMPTGTPQKPTAIISEEELKKAFPDEGTQAKLLKAVDFTKQKMVFFSWSGSGQDALTFTEDTGDKGLKVMFSYQPGRTRDLRPHSKLLVLPKDATWSMAK